jgi:hypothetical protein
MTLLYKLMKENYPEALPSPHQWKGMFAAFSDE